MKLENIRYPKYPSQILEPMEFTDKMDDIRRYALLAAEFGYSKEAQDFLDEFENQIKNTIEKFNDLLEEPGEDPEEPEELSEILAKRMEGKRRLCISVPDDYQERFLGSFLGRGAGCTLGAGLEFQSVDNMRIWAEHFGDTFPLTNYWSEVKNPEASRYITGNATNLTKGRMNSIPVDDDTAYTLLGLLTLEKYGPDFTHEQMARLWNEEVEIHAENGSWGLFWGERKFINNYRSGMKAERAGYYKNPNVQSVAAWTRADAWGYVAPGWPEKAAQLAYRDATANHRRNGVYGEMFMAAAVSAAFAVDDPREALEIALCEIPSESLFADAVRWAFSVAPHIHNYKDAVAAVTSRYQGMFEGHAVNNALYVIFGILIGGRDFTKVIGETVAMGFDNDCTGATAGSIVGAVIGKKNLPAYWYEPFQNRGECYFRSCPRYLDIDELETRFYKQAKLIYNER